MARSRKRSVSGQKDAPAEWVYRNLTPFHIVQPDRAHELGRRSDGPDLDGQRDGHVQDGPVQDGPVQDGPVQDRSSVAGPVRQPIGGPFIPPLGELRVPHRDAKNWRTASLRRWGQIDVRPADTEGARQLPRMVVVGTWSVLATAALIALVLGFWSSWLCRVLAAVALATPLFALGLNLQLSRQLARRYSNYAASQLETADASSDQADTEPSRFGRFEALQLRGTYEAISHEVPQAIAVAFVLLLSVLVSVIGPAVAVYYGSQLRSIVPIDWKALLAGKDPFPLHPAGLSTSRAFWQLVVAHGAQWAFVSLAIVTPALLFFQFTRERLAAIRQRWIWEVFRLDPTVRTIGDIDGKYGPRIEASLGSVRPGAKATLINARRSPVLMATLLFAVGWSALVVLAVDVPTLVNLNDGGRAAVLTSQTSLSSPAQLAWAEPAGAGTCPDGTGPTPVDGLGPACVVRPSPAAFFIPRRSFLAFAFLGAYFFAIHHLLRGFYRRDLRPRSYTTIIVRTFSALVLALVFEAVAPANAATVPFAFFVGFVPQSALIRLRELASKTTGLLGAVPIDQTAPLTDLEGLDLYDRTRLAEEGINNIQGLAHADIIELMSSTRIGADRLIDWADQAILYLRVGGTGVDCDGRPDRAWYARTRANLRHLRQLGIRNATDLLQSYQAALARGEAEALRERPTESAKDGTKGSAEAPRDTEDSVEARVARYQRREVMAFRQAIALPQPAGCPPDFAPVQAVLDTLPDEEWFTQIRRWRESEFGKASSRYWYLDGTSREPRRAKTLPRDIEDLERGLTVFSMAGIGEEAENGAPVAQQPGPDVDLTDKAPQAREPRRSPGSRSGARADRS